MRPHWVRREGGVAVALVPDRPGRRGETARATVAELLHVPLEAVALHRQPGGKPVLHAPHGGACSFAHRAGHSLIGAAVGWEIGVDLEVVRADLPVADIAGDFFAPAEAAWVRALPAEHRALGFTALWSAKEAVLKMAGQGITAGLREPGMNPAALAALLDGTAVRVTLPGCVRVGLERVRLGMAEAVVAVATARAGDQSR